MRTLFPMKDTRRSEPDILMIAAENAALAGAKVGGLGDVLRDLPPALAGRGCRVCVATPSYGFLHRVPGASMRGALPIPFYGAPHEAVFYEVASDQAVPGVQHLVVDHPLFHSPPDPGGRPRIYHMDPPDAPFATDATRFAFFGSAMAEAVESGLLNQPDCLHLHDWHAATLLVVRRFRPAARRLNAARTVFSVHNLALQGVRPFEGHASSLAAWYPHLAVARHEIADPRWPNCLNPMAAGIRFADAVHTVSPSYAEEILRPSDPPRFFGGEGLERDLQAARAQDRLFGILNGTRYDEGPVSGTPDFPELLGLLKEAVLGWTGGSPTVATAHFLACSRLSDWGGLTRRPALLVTAVTRVAAQKLFLLKAPVSAGPPALHRLLETLQAANGRFILLGAGEPEYERFLTETSARFSNFIFLNGYSDAAAQALYASGDLFVMPSSYEPCGISQMLAMRRAQPCVVHRVGGLKDTVIDNVNGFAFGGEGVTEQADNFVSACARATRCRLAADGAWEEIRRRAAAARFSWDDAAAAYMERLYRIPAQQVVEKQRLRP